MPVNLEEFVNSTVNVTFRDGYNYKDTLIRKHSREYPYGFLTEREYTFTQNGAFIEGRESQQDIVEINFSEQE